MKLSLALVLGLLGVTVWTIPGMGWVIFCLLLVAGLLPCNRATYLDVGGSVIIKASHYAWLALSEDRRPLAEFSAIVVRHVCHPSDDGPDYYTGGVGLKPVDGKAVLWVKQYPATEDDFPAEAFDFAQELAARTGLPFVSSGALRR